MQKHFLFDYAWMSTNKSLEWLQRSRRHIAPATTIPKLLQNKEDRKCEPNESVPISARPSIEVWLLTSICRIVA